MKKYDTLLNDSTAFVVNKEKADEAEKAIQTVVQDDYQRYDDITELAFDSLSQHMLNEVKKDKDFTLKHFNSFKDELVKPYIENKSGQFNKVMFSRANKYIGSISIEVKMEDDNK